MSSYGERLAAVTAARGRLCVGIDPHRSVIEAWGYEYGLEPGEAVLVAPGLDHRAVRIDPHAQSTPRGRDRSQAFSVRAHVVLLSCRALMPATRPVPE